MLRALHFGHAPCQNEGKCKTVLRKLAAKLVVLQTCTEGHVERFHFYCQRVVGEIFLDGRNVCCTLVRAVEGSLNKAVGLLQMEHQCK